MPSARSAAECERAAALKKLPALPAEATTTAAPRPFGLGTSFVHVERAAVQIPSVESVDGRITLGVVAHFNESKTTWLSGIAISDNVDPIHGAISFKKRADRLLRRAKTEISYKNILHPAKSFCDLKSL